MSWERNEACTTGGRASADVCSKASAALEARQAAVSYAAALLRTLVVYSRLKNSLVRGLPYTSEKGMGRAPGACGRHEQTNKRSSSEGSEPSLMVPEAAPEVADPSELPWPVQPESRSSSHPAAICL